MRLPAPTSLFPRLVLGSDFAERCVVSDANIKSVIVVDSNRGNGSKKLGSDDSLSIVGPSHESTSALSLPRLNTLGS